MKMRKKFSWREFRALHHPPSAEQVVASSIHCWKATLPTPTFDGRYCSGSPSIFVERKLFESMVFFGALALAHEFVWTENMAASQSSAPYYGNICWNARFSCSVAAHCLMSHSPGIIVIAQQFSKYILRVYHIWRGIYVERVFFNQKRGMRRPKKGKLKVLKIPFSANKLREKKKRKCSSTWMKRLRKMNRDFSEGFCTCVYRFPNFSCAAISPSHIHILCALKK